MHFQIRDPTIEIPRNTQRCVMWDLWYELKKLISITHPISKTVSYFRLRMYWSMDHRPWTDNENFVFLISCLDSNTHKSENLSLENYLIKVPSPFEGRKSGWGVIKIQRPLTSILSPEGERKHVVRIVVKYIKISNIFG